MSNSDSYIDIVCYLRLIWQKKYYYILSAVLCGILSVLYSLKIPNKYKASVELVSTEIFNGQSNNNVGKLGGFASFAGLSIGQGGTNARVGLLSNIVYSRGFIEKFVKRYELEVDLIASVGWDENSRAFIRDESIYDDVKQQWVTDLSDTKRLWTAYSVFSDMLRYQYDVQSGVVTISIETLSPDASKLWLDRFVDFINFTFRDIDRKNSESKINFLKKKVSQTEVAEMEQVFFRLIEEEVKKSMLIEINSQYMLSTISAAQVPVTKSGPKRMVIVFVSIIFGFLSVLIFISIKYRADFVK